MLNRTRFGFVMIATATLLPGLASAVAFSDDARKADLLGVYQAALQNDPQLSAARHAFEGQVEAVPQAMSGLLPSISAGTKTEVTRLDRDRPALTRERSGNTFQANLSQPLFHADRWYQLKAARSSVYQAELELAAKEQALILTSAQAYFETLRALDALAAAKAEEAALLRQRDQAQGKLDDGASSITDVYDAQAAYDNARANRQLAKRKVDDAFEALSRLTNASYESIAGMGHQLPTEPPVPSNPSVWVDKAVRQNLRLLATAKAVNAAQLGVQQASLLQSSAARQEAERRSDGIVAQTRRAMLDLLQQAEQKANSLAQDLTKAQYQDLLTTLRAPVSGTVQQLNVHTIGGVITPAQPLLTLVPDNQPVEVEAMLENKDIGFVHPHQKVTVKVETFTFTKYGTVPGEVMSVSDDAIDDEKKGLIYSTKVRLDSDHLSGGAVDFPLSPGMAVTVEIKTDERRIIDYFISPLEQQLRESIHER